MPLRCMNFDSVPTYGYDKSCWTGICYKSGITLCSPVNFNVDLRSCLFSVALRDWWRKLWYFDALISWSEWWSAIAQGRRINWQSGPDDRKVLLDETAYWIHGIGSMKKDIGLLWEVFWWKDRRQVVCRVLKGTCWSTGHHINASHGTVLRGRLYSMINLVWTTECTFLSWSYTKMALQGSSLGSW